MLTAFVVLALLTVWALVVVTLGQVIQVDRSRQRGQRAEGARLVCRTCGAHVAVLFNATIEPPRHPSRPPRPGNGTGRDGRA